MVKFQVQALSRDPLKHDRALGAPALMERNLLPKYHPHEKAREYKRAENAAKWERMFAKPFVRAFGDHVDTVGCLAKHPTQLRLVGAIDFAGDVRLWNVPAQRAELYIPHAHQGMARGMTFTPDGSAFLTCGNDKMVKMWVSSTNLAPEKIRPMAEFSGEHNFDCISYHSHNQQFVTAGQNLEFWDLNRTRPIHSFTWEDEAVNVCAYSRNEPHMVLCLMRDRAVCLYDSRAQQAVQKMYLVNRCNAVIWNPMQPTDFAVCSDDTNVYIVDSRHLKKAKTTLVGHTSTVMSVDYSPTGKELVSGSFDQTVRLWSLTDLTNERRDTYCGKRMAHVWSVLWTADNNFILSGSADCNLRIWKAYSNKPLKKLEAREATALDYNDSLKERYKHLPLVRKVLSRRPLPKSVKGVHSKRLSISKSRKRKETNAILHGEKPSGLPASMRKQRVLAVVD
jgi:WD repeat and SOF domain-containing protein 1